MTNPEDLSYQAQISQLRKELEEANDLIEAIRTGAIDAIAVHGDTGPQIFTLQSADHTYRVLVEKMNEGALILNKEGTLIYCNSSFANFIGAPIHDLIGTQFYKLVAPDFLQAFEKIFEKGWTESSKGELLLQHKEGAWVPYAMSINVMEIDGGSALSMIVTDISSKAEIEAIKTHIELQNELIEEKDIQLKRDKESKKEARRLRFVLEGIPQMTWTNLPSGEVNFYNQRWYDYTGITFEDTKELGWKTVLHPDDFAHTLNTYTEALSKGDIFSVESRYRRASDGSYRWHISRALPVKNEKGQIILWVGTATDIDDQKQSEERLKFIAETVPQIFWTAQPNGNLDYFNKRWYDYTGLTFEETKDWEWTVALHNEDLERCITLWKDCLATGNDYQIEYRFKRASDGAYRWHLGRALALKDKSGDIIKWFGTCTDIDDQKEALNKLSKTKEQLKLMNLDLSLKNEQLLKINNDLDNFIYTASHDLKAPVSNIEGLVYTLEDVLLQEGNGNKEVEQILGLINQSIGKFKTTILDLTEITKIQKGEGEDIEVQNICDIIEDVMDSISDMIQKSNANIEIETSACHLITFSKKNLKSIVYNLLSNAIKYRSFDKKPEISITTDLVDDYILLIVKDNGLGMDLKKDNKIFTMFKRLHDHVEGTGIGLYLVKRIIDNAGGRIEVESKVGEGTTFRVYLKNL
ncbi:MAG TPA: PAS domain-containing sensor histidine kinase [Cytophagaceae bacterium]|jgi:PAS domain S-box-containing protein